MTIITTTTIEMKMLILEDVHLKDIKMVICSQLLKLARPNQPFLEKSMWKDLTSIISPNRFKMCPSSLHELDSNVLGISSHDLPKCRSLNDEYNVIFVLIFFSTEKRKVLLVKVFFLSFEQLEEIIKRIRTNIL